MPFLNLLEGWGPGHFCSKALIAHISKVLKSNWIPMRKIWCPQYGFWMFHRNKFAKLIIKLWLVRVKVLPTENPFVSLIQMSISKNWRYRPHWGCFFARLSIIVLSFVWFYSKDFFQSFTGFLILEQRSMNFT